MVFPALEDQVATSVTYFGSRRALFAQSITSKNLVALHDSMIMVGSQGVLYNWVVKSVKKPGFD